MVYIWLRAQDGTFPAGTPYYVGKTVRRYRINGERHVVNPPKDKTNIRLLDCESEADALKLEVLLIRIHGRIDLGTGCLRNMTDGGDGTSNPSLETRTKIGASKIGNTYWVGRKHSEESRRKQSAARKGYTYTAEHRQNLSAALKGRISPMLGRTPSEETRRKISAFHMGNTYMRGRKLSEETRQKMSVARMGNTNTLGYKHSEKSRQKMSAAQMGNTYSLGHKHSTEARAKMMGNTNCLGRKYSEETLLKMSIAAIAREARKRAARKEEVTNAT